MCWELGMCLVYLVWQPQWLLINWASHEDRSSTLKSEESWNAIARQCSRSSKQKVQSLSKCRILSGRLRRNPEWFVPRWKGAHKKGRREIGDGNENRSLLQATKSLFYGLFCTRRFDASRRPPSKTREGWGRDYVQRIFMYFY